MRRTKWLRPEWFHWALKALVEKPVGPAPIVVVRAPMLDAVSGDLEAVTWNRFQRVLGANAFAAQRFGQNRKPIRDRQGRPQERQVPYLDSAVKTSGEEPLAVWTEFGPANLKFTLVTKRLGDQVRGEGVPDAGGAVATGGGEESSVRAPFDVPDYARVVHR